MNRKMLKELQDKLIDTNRRNRSIRLSRIIKKRCFDMSDLGKIHEGRDDKILEKLFFKGKSEDLISLNAKSEAEEKALESLKHLYRELDSTFKERGTYECFLGYPFVQGNFSDGKFFRAPLFLLPVKITRNSKTGKMRLETRGDSKIEANKTFFMALKRYNKERNSLDLERLKETENLAGDELILWAKKLFEEWGFEVISRETEEKIIRLNDLKTNEHPEYPFRRMEFKPFFILGQFSQTSEAIYDDYGSMMESEDELIEKILGKETERDVENERDEDDFVDSPEEDNFFMDELDSSQEKAIVNSRKENGTVIHGPPGTGKSQVITNLIADNLPRGKKILLVCEKRTALDVVKNRLRNIKKNCILVHDCNNDRDSTFRDMASVLDDYESNAGNNPGGRKHEVNVAKKSEEIDEKITDVRELINLFNDFKERGITLRNLYNLTEKGSPRILDNPTMENDEINFEGLKKLSKEISSLSEGFYGFENEDFPLFNRERFGDDFDEESFKETVRGCAKDFHELETILHDGKTKNQIKLISAGEKNLEFLKNVYGELKQYEELKNRKHKMFSFFRWKRLKSRYSELLKEEDLNRLLSRWEETNEALMAVEKRINDLKRHFKEEEIKKIESNVASFDSNADFFRKIEEETFNVLEDVTIFDGKLKKLSDFETVIARKCFERLKEDGDAKTIWEDAIKKNFYLKWINEAESKHPKIREFSGRLYDEKISELRELMKEKIELIPKMIEEFLSENYSEEKHKKLIHEVNKKRRKMTIRGLIGQYWDEVISSIFPCWMCSPETVSAIFPMKKDMFDLVIFDEASQVKLEKSLPALFRAKKCIVSGDEKQLPPTDFFGSGKEELEDEDYEHDEKQTTESESLLEQAKRVFSGDHHLTHHYRSEFEELIDFSNYAFYNGRLKTPPKNRTEGEIPIEYVNVKGTWESRTNDKEAREVVKRVKEILLKRKDNSTIGIITFNGEQMSLIKDLLDEEAKEDPEFGVLLDKEHEREEEGEDKSLFVKNIENVQGDERDIIIFSTGYGYNKLNKFRFGFGPISNSYGENRLNVAISRSRKKIIIYSSMEASDFNNYRGKSKGTKLLRDYLKYCECVSSDRKKEAYNLLNGYVGENKTKSPEHEEFDSEFEAEVKDELDSLGYEVKTQVGSMGYKIDLGVVHPEDKTKYLAGVECDGATYHSSRSAKERDLHRQKILEDNGWVIFRVWSRDWWKNKKEVIKKLDRKLKSKL